MISRIDHVSLAVRDFRKAADFFSTVLGAVPCSWSGDEKMGYLWHIFALGDLSRLELLTPTGEGSFLRNFLAKGDGVHHITLQTPDIGEMRRLLEGHGIPYFGYYEYPGGEWKELYIYPRDAFGVLIQIAEFTPHDLIGSAVSLPRGERWRVDRKSGEVSLTLSHPGGGTVKVSLTEAEAWQLARDLSGESGPGDGNTGVDRP
jgi:methylmalonyl-CoA/ethylmalonyl-CoA epimerase